MDRKLRDRLLGTALIGSFAMLIAPAIGIPYLLLLTAGGAAAFRARGHGGGGAYFRRLDDVLYAGEQTIVSAALIVMTLVVFVDVVWRTSQGTDPTTGAVLIGLVLALCLIGGLTARRESAASAASRIAYGLGGFAVLATLGAAIHSADNGFGWSQRLGLVLMLWVGMLGTSMAARDGRHIRVDAVRRTLPEPLVRPFQIAGDLITLGFLLGLTTLAVQYVRGNWDDWIESEMAAGVFASLPVPYWAATLPIIVGFGLMAARTLGDIVAGPTEVDLLSSLGADGLDAGDADDADDTDSADSADVGVRP